MSTAPSNHRPWAQGHSLRTHGPPRGFALAALRWAGRGLLRASTYLVQPYMDRKRRNAVPGERLAQAMMRYAELCMSAGKTPRDLQQAATYLDKAAALYMEIGQPEKAAEAQALKEGARVDDDDRRQ